MSMRFNDGPVYPRRESEIIRINNETPHAVSLAGEFYLLAIKVGECCLEARTTAPS